MTPKTQSADPESASSQDAGPTTSPSQGRPAQHVIQLRNIYWRKLIQEGIPSNEAREIANGIANYDAMQTLPTMAQKQLIGHYCTFIARAQLWRLELLMGKRTH